jgi:hypothetical protein
MQASTTDSSSDDGYDALVISSTITSSDARDKFEDTAAGVLNWEEALQKDTTGDFQLSTATAKPTTQTQINIVDNTHYITSGFSTGLLTIFSSGTETEVLTGTYGSGVNVLAQSSGVSSEAALAYVETGGGLLGDGSPGNPSTADGRRVTFPITDSGFSNLNANGLTLFGRSTDWAASIPEPATLALTLTGFLAISLRRRRRTR